MQWILFTHQSTNAKGLEKIESAFIKASPYQKEEKEKYILSIQNILQLNDVITYFFPPTY